MVNTNDKNNTSFSYFVLLMIVIVFFDVLAMQCLKFHNIHNNIKYYFISCFIYGIIISFLVLKSLNLSSIVVVNFSWFCIGTLINIIIGIYLYKEQMNYKKLLGVIIAFLGAYIIYCSD